MMKLSRCFSIFVYLIFAHASSSVYASSVNQLESYPHDKWHVIGETAMYDLPEHGIKFLARVDSGARSTSVHAVDLNVIGGVEDKQDNIGKMIEFTMVNEHGEKKKVQAKIDHVQKVRNAQGVEHRYVVLMDLTWQSVSKKVRVNLRDRSHMSYKLLIGRNWLSDDILINVSFDEGLIEND